MRTGRRALCAGLLAVAALAIACATDPSSPPAAGSDASDEANRLSSTPLRDAHAASATPSTPAFWRIDGGAGATLYILGSIHFGPAGGWSYPRSVERAFAESSAMVVEVDVRAVDAAEQNALVTQYALYPPGETLEDHLTPDTMEQLLIYLEQSDLDTETMMALRPWMLSTLVVVDSIEQQGMNAQLGVDRSFLARAGDRKVLALETAESQIVLLAGMSPELQELALRDSLDRTDDAALAIRSLIAAWRRGNEDALLAVLREPLTESPEFGPFYELILDERNRMMATKLARLAGDANLAGRSVFVIVGAAHTVGPESVIDLLSKQGLEFHRVIDEPPVAEDVR